MATNALILSGGGARAAYQVGVLSAINELLPRSTHNPFPIICGTSAGALNALALATHTGHYYEAVENLNQIWSDMRTDRVYLTTWWGMMSGGLRILQSFFHGGVNRQRALSLLDNSPLRVFIDEHIDFSQLQGGFDNRDLKAICVTAMNYSSGESVSFFQGDESIQPWRRYRRIGIHTELNVEHLMASTAIPGIFPAVKLEKDYFGDGAMRQLAPISPALHMGADRIFVIGVSGNRNPVHWAKRHAPPKHTPSVAQVFGHLFSSAFIDGLESDIEHIERVNLLLEQIPEERLQEADIRLRPVETMVVSPSKQLDKIAGRNVRNMPRSVRAFLRAAGGTAKGGGAGVASYLMFEKPFIDELIDLGYQDTMWEKDKILDFFQC